MTKIMLARACCTLVVSIGLPAVVPAHADESQVRLKDGDAKPLVQANCSTCHSLDYIELNSVFLDRKGWEGIVRKMVKVMGAPIRSEDMPAIVDYLTRNYGKP